MKRIYAICSLLLSVAIIGSPLVAFAQSAVLSQDQLDIMANECSNIQVTLSQLEKNDAVSRINRGRDYDQALTQISAFDSRLSYNKVSAPQFQQLASQLQTAVSQFRGDYTTYDGQLSNAIGANCKNKPQDFYTLIVEARSARTKLSDEVTVIASLMSQYRDAMVQYQNSLSGSGGVQ